MHSFVSKKVVGGGRGSRSPSASAVPTPQFCLDRPAASSHRHAFSVSISSRGAHIKINFPLYKSLNLGTKSPALNFAFINSSVTLFSM